jgi:MFS transporter, MFS domain-containing protein family, molybdate-anion transporter
LSLCRRLSSSKKKEASFSSSFAKQRTMPSSLLPSGYSWDQDPSTLFHTCLAILLSLVFSGKLLISKNNTTTTTGDQKNDDDDDDQPTIKPATILRLQRQFLPVFWLLRAAFWINGPYFYAAYASKINARTGQPISTATISYIFLTGFASIAIIGPFTGNWLDQYGRKRGTIAAAMIASVGALSLRSNSLPLLFVGRAVGGLGMSAMSAAPEAWVITAFQNSEKDPFSEYLRETFGTAFSMDSVVAIAAGQLAGFVASRRGPTAPFELSPLFLALAAALAGYSWNENYSSNSSITTQTESASIAKDDAATTDDNNDDNSSGPTLREAVSVLMDDPKILLVGIIQSLFESAMNIFVMIWPPALNGVILEYFGAKAITPYGTVFSCFMAW